MDVERLSYTLHKNDFTVLQWNEALYLPSRLLSSIDSMTVIYGGLNFCSIKNQDYVPNL